MADPDLCLVFPKTYDDDNHHSCWGNDGWVDHHCMTKCRQFPRTAARRFWDNSKTKKKAFQKNRILQNNFFSRIKNLQRWFWCIVCGGVVSEEGRQVALLPFIYQPAVSWRHLYSIHSYLIEHGLLCHWRTTEPDSCEELRMASWKQKYKKTRPSKLCESQTFRLGVYLKNVHPLKISPLKNILPWKLVAPEKYSPMKKIHPWQIFTPEK